MENLGNNPNSLLYYNLLANVLFKNPNTRNNLYLDALEQGRINSILYSDPFLKAGFISKLVQDANLEVLYLDLDLLYSGYVASDMLPTRDNVSLFQPNLATLDKALKEILVKASLSQTIIIVDSLNGLFNILNRKKNIGMMVMSIIMLLASIAKMTKSYLVVTSLVRFKKEEGWVLSPTGKRLIETKNAKKILLEYGKEGIIVNLVDDTKKYEIPANLIPLV